MGPARYLIAFSAYAVAQAARHTPAYREPYRIALDGAVRRMLQPVAFRDWIEVWKRDDPLGPDNIMFSGHLVHMMTLQRLLFDDHTWEQPVSFHFQDKSWATDVRTLAAAIAKQADENRDDAGRPYYGVACEPGRVYVPCNTPHRVNQLLFDRLYGTHLAATNNTWIDWLKAQMIDEKHPVMHDLYWPFGLNQSTPNGTMPARDDELSGVYNAWSIWYLDALDHPFAASLYAGLKDYFVMRGTDSPFPDGRTMVIDMHGEDSPAALAMTILATGFTQVVARQMGDNALGDELDQSWSKVFGEPDWNDDHTQWGWDRLLYPRVAQDMFPLLARTTTPEINIRTTATLDWGEAHFREPFVEQVSSARAFVNQAYWDNATSRLTVTLNGGEATTDPAEVTVANLPAGPYTVRRDGQIHENWRWNGAKLIIVTPGLQPQEESYTIEPGAPPMATMNAAGCACRTNGATRPTGTIIPFFLLAIFLARRFSTKRRQYIPPLAVALLFALPARAGEPKPEEAPRLVPVNLPAPKNGPEIVLHQTIAFIPQGRGLSGADGLGFRSASLSLHNRVCTAPCTATLPTDGVFFVNGPLIVRSSAFRLRAKGDSFTLTVYPGSYPGRVTSILFTVIGLGLLATAGGLLGDAATTEEQYKNRPGNLPSSFDPTSIDRERNTAIGLAISGGIGAVAGLIGILVTRTVVTPEPGTHRESSIKPVPGGIVF